MSGRDRRLVGLIGKADCGRQLFGFLALGDRHLTHELRLFLYSNLCGGICSLNEVVGVSRLGR